MRRFLINAMKFAKIGLLNNASDSTLRFGLKLNDVPFFLLMSSVSYYTGISVANIYDSVERSHNAPMYQIYSYRLTVKKRMATAIHIKCHPKIHGLV